MASPITLNEAYLVDGLNEALSIVNQRLEVEEKSYEVFVALDKQLKPKEPIYLELVQEGEKIPIGITHFIHLDEKFDEPFKEIIRTIEELAASIFTAIEIYEKNKENSDVIFTSVGTPLFKSGFDIEIKEGFLLINKIPIIYEGKPFEARRLCGEEGLGFEKVENGDLKVINPIDKRGRGKNIYFSLKSGEIYRK